MCVNTLCHSYDVLLNSASCFNSWLCRFILSVELVQLLYWLIYYIVNEAVVNKAMT